MPRRLMDRFDGILSALAHCQGVACRNPYAVLHPGQPVFNLTGVRVSLLPGARVLRTWDACVGGVLHPGQPTFKLTGRSKRVCRSAWVACV